MTAGGASTINESFGIPFWLSSLILVVLILLTLFLQFDRLIAVLGGVTPFLVAIVVMIAMYYFITGHVDFTAANEYSIIINLFHPVGGSMRLTTQAYKLLLRLAFNSDGRQTEVQKSTIYGGLIGGIIITFLLLMINLGLVTEFNKIKHVALPSLLLAKQISPSIGTIMSVIMVLVIYNTVVGLMYAFASRFSQPFTKRYYSLIIVMSIITFICTFIGFISLIGKVFPIMGLFGFILLIPVIYKGILRK